MEDENARRERYREVISGGDCRELMRLIRTLHLQRKKQQERGKHLRLSDERFQRGGADAARRIRPGVPPGSE